MALALSGSDCAVSQQEIITTLQQLEGVAKVEANVVPDHLLVDHDGTRLTGEELASYVTRLTALNGRCRAAVMESCITAGPLRPLPKR